MKITISETGKIGKGEMGLFLDDINYAIDGGLNAEMLENRNFEATVYQKGGFAACGDHGWTPYPAEGSAALKVKTDRPLHLENPHYMRVVANADGAGMRNRAYGGLTLRRGTEYEISFFVRSYEDKNTAYVGAIGEKTLFEKKVKIKPDGKWRRYSFKCKSKADVSGAEFHFTLAKAGMVHADCFSMRPVNAILKLFRRDLIALIEELKPRFLRFPGGGVVAEYRWKGSVGGRDLRRHFPNCHAAGSAALAHYGQTLDLGFYEYFRLAEYLGAQPIPALPVGECGEETETYVQDALDLIEFANGSADTMWGSLRAELGHPVPFHLSAIALGSAEQAGSEEARKRIEIVASAIRAKDEKIKLLTPSDEKEEGHVREVRLVLPPDELQNATIAQLGDDEETHVVYAAAGATEGRLSSALAEAALLTELENAAVCGARTYAPLFARDGYAQTPALIRFDGSRAFGTPSYYVQKLFSLYTGANILHAQADASLPVSATEQEGVTYVKAVNLSDDPVEAEVEGEHDFGALNRVILIEGDPAACNTASEPTKIAARDVAPAAPRTALLPPHSFCVLVFRK